MKNYVVSALFLLVIFTFAVSASAAVPQCVLGGLTAMNPNRQLVEGETFVNTDRPLVVNLQFKPTVEHPEQVGECMLPKGSKVAQKDGIMQWVAECGNDEVNKNIFVIPFSPQNIKGEKGDPGMDGMRGPEGPRGPQGDPGQNLVAHQSHSRCGTICKVVIGVVVVGVIAGATHHGHGRGRGPGGNTGPAF